MAESIHEILESRQRASKPGVAKVEEDKFFSVLGGDVVEDPFLELRFRDGFRLCLPYRDVVWFSYDPKGPDIKLDFGSTTVRIKGRGLAGELFDGLKQRRVMWIKEADLEMQDHDKNTVFISDIGFEPEENATESAE